MTTGRITLYIAMSIDGYIADENGGVDWLDDFSTETTDDTNPTGYLSFFETVDCLIMGATTYEQVLSFGPWPYENKPTYVFTHRPLEPATDAVKFVDEDISSFVNSLKQDYDQIWLVGGAQLTHSFLRASAIDEFRLSFIPILLGNGIPLFTNDYGRQRLRHTSTKTHEHDIVEHTYEIYD